MPATIKRVFFSQINGTSVMIDKTLFFVKNKNRICSLTCGVCLVKSKCDLDGEKIQV